MEVATSETRSRIAEALETTVSIPIELMPEIDFTMLSIPVIQLCYSIFRCGRIISARLLRSPASSDCAFIPVGCSVSSRYTFPEMGLARRCLLILHFRKYFSRSQQIISEIGKIRARQRAGHPGERVRR